MVRPRTPVGTYGKIHTVQVRPKTKDQPAVWEARARFRMRNGRLRPVSRRGPTETAAVNALKTACAGLTDEVAGKKLSRTSRFAHASQLWLDSFERKVKQGVRAPKSLYDYRDTVRLYVVPRLGELTCGEVETDVGLCDETIKDVQDKVGHGAAKRLRVVMTGICGLAVRQGAMATNPIRSVEAITAPQVKRVQVLEPSQRRDFLDKLTAQVKARTDASGNRLGPRGAAWLDLPEIALAGLATGGRIGEVLAATGDDVDPGQRLITLSHHLIRVEGVGMVRQPLRKGRRDQLTVMYPTWAAAMMRRRKLRSGGGPLFPTWNGQWPDPSNVMKRLRKACDAAGYPGVTSHWFRRTVGTHLGDQDISSTAIGDQLGNSADVVEGHYRRKRVANAAIADALESLLDAPEPARQDGHGEAG